MSDFGLKEAAISGNVPQGRGVVPMVAYIITTVLGVVGVIALIFVIYGGFMWMTAAGNEEKLQQAKKILISSVIGLLLILSAYTIISFVITGLKKTQVAPSAPTSSDTPKTAKQCCIETQASLNSKGSPINDIILDCSERPKIQCGICEGPITSSPPDTPDTCGDEDANYIWNECNSSKCTPPH